MARTIKVTVEGKTGVIDDIIVYREKSGKWDEIVRAYKGDKRSRQFSSNKAEDRVRVISLGKEGATLQFTVKIGADAPKSSTYTLGKLGTLMRTLDV